MPQDTPDRKMSKPTFAKVASTSYVPIGVKSSPSLSPQPTSNPTGESPESSAVNGLKESTPCETIQKNETQAPEDTSSNDSTSIVKSLPDSVRIDDTYVKQSSNDDGFTQISSDGSAKLPSYDTKSVASATTFAMDEKESLRPDDSASIRAAAVEDDELVSAPGSVIAGSRVGSDLGAKAFREQLHEIAGISPLRVNDSSSNHFNGPAVVNSSRTPQSQPSDQLQLMSIATPNMQHNIHPPQIPPDEKLLEALQSPRDRVFVLKLEQDLIDFIEQSKESTLALPKCNGFYRMLAHKLADYYRLDHNVEPTHTGGAAVIITRTSFCGLAPPLSGLPSSSASNTPPLVIQARKIMRRPEDPKTSETSTAANSEGPSAAASDVGAENGVQDPSPSSSSDTKPKASLTREEREAKYAEVRERIFGKNEGNPDGNDTADGSEENYESRASSTTGKKKPVNKQRNLSNDDFEPRSQYYGPNPAPNGYPNDQFYYQNYTGVHPGSPYPMPPSAAPAISYVPAYPGMIPAEGQTQFGWQAPPMQIHHTSVTMPSYPQGPNGVYDMSAHFNSGMQSFQNASPAGQMHGKMPSPVTSGYPQPPSTNQYGQPPPYDHNYQYSRPGYPPPSMNDRQVPAPMMIPPPGQYNYGQYQPMPGPIPTNNYTPGNLNRPQFNPQIRSFVPGAPTQAPMVMPAAVPPYGPHPSISVHMPPPMNRPVAIQGHPDNRSNYSSPRPGSTTTPIPHNSTPSIVTTQESSAASSSSSPLSAQPSTKPVSEITAKWGTPAHLPRKPPPPESMEPHKYMEINKGLHQQYPGLPRINSNGFGNNGFNGNANNRFGS